MSLHDELLALREDVAWPPEPAGLAARVRERIAAEPRRSARGRPPRRLLVAIAALLVLAVGAIPPARGAVLRLIGIEASVEVVRVERLPLAATGAGELSPGTRVTLAEARALAPFRLRVPAGLGTPAAVRFSAALAGGVVTLSYSGGVELIEFAGAATPFAQKLVGPGTTVRRVGVDGARGLFVTGAAHVVVLEDERGRTVTARTPPGADVTLWERAGVGYRLQTRGGLTRALAVAARLR